MIAYDFLSKTVLEISYKAFDFTLSAMNAETIH